MNNNSNSKKRCLEDFPCRHQQQQEEEEEEHRQQQQQQHPECSAMKQISITVLPKSNRRRRSGGLLLFDNDMIRMMTAVVLIVFFVGSCSTCLSPPTTLRHVEGFMAPKRQRQVPQPQRLLPQPQLQHVYVDQSPCSCNNNRWSSSSSSLFVSSKETRDNNDSMINDDDNDDNNDHGNNLNIENNDNDICDVDGCAEASSIIGKDLTVDMQQKYKQVPSPTTNSNDPNNNNNNINDNGISPPLSQSQPSSSSSSLPSKPPKRKMSSSSSSPLHNKNNGSPPPPPHEVVTEQTIRSLFVLFNSALATGESKIVAQRYTEDAVLVPCTGEAPCMTPKAIEEYYDQYLLQRPQKKVVDEDILSTNVVGGNNNDNDEPQQQQQSNIHQQRRRIKISPDHTWAEDTGQCIITFMTAQGTTRLVQARYSFLYVYDTSKRQWKILHHHSSLLGPDGDVSKNNVLSGTFPPSMMGSSSGSSAFASSSSTSSWAGPMTVERVQNLFQLMVQDTWAVGDADAFASRFHHREGLLMPLNVYERPRVGYDDILEYWNEFVFNHRPVIYKVQRTCITLDQQQEQPQRWAKDVGNMQITFQASQRAMDVRYSIDYILDESDGTWKILQFHMTPLPSDWHSFNYEDTVSSEAEVRPVLEIDEDSHSNEQGLSAPPVVTEDEVRAWFEEWNSAVASHNAGLVASRYARQAVLMPSLSYTNPRTTPEEILDYYRVFLWSKPEKAQVLHRHITITKNYVEDAGVLEYTFGKNSVGQPERVRERYSFLYVFDTVGGWKIMHHQQALVAEQLHEDGTCSDGQTEVFQ